jgi:hypothetical protein
VGGFGVARGRVGGREAGEKFEEVQARLGYGLWGGLEVGQCFGMRPR